MTNKYCSWTKNLGVCGYINVNEYSMITIGSKKERRSCSFHKAASKWMLRLETGKSAQYSHNDVKIC